MRSPWEVALMSLTVRTEVNVRGYEGGLEAGGVGAGDD